MRRCKRSHLLLAGAILAFAGRAATAAEPNPAAVTILDTLSFWRFRIVWETEEIVRASGEVGHFRFVYDRNWFHRHPKAVAVAKGEYRAVPVPCVRLPEHTSPDWMQPGYDDSAWVRQRGPMFTYWKGRGKDRLPLPSRQVYWKLIQLRGRFEVADPARAGDLTLSLAFRGGAVAYLNGREVLRSFMPKGKITATTPALPYPEDIYLDDKGYLVWPYDDVSVYADRVKKQVRRVRATIPAARLHKGVNVLAVAIHRAPTSEQVYVRRIKRYPMTDPRAYWNKAGLIEVRLAAPAGAAVAPNTSAPKGRGFLVWNHSIVRKVFLGDFPDPFAPLRPVRIVAARNGTFAGQVVVGDEKPILGLRAVASPLKGPGILPASAVRLFYARPDGRPASRGGPRPFDTLEEFPPAIVPVYKEHGGSVQPVWIRVSVPADARPGDYEGTVTLSARGVKPVAVPLKVRVMDWTLPDPNAFTARMDIVESPDSLALAYNVPMWSDEHLRLVDKAFSLLRPLACKTVYITAIRRTHWGNEHAMVRWYRDDKGELQPDFTIVEKYLDIARKHLGNIPGVILYTWEPAHSMGHAGGAGGAARTTDKPILYTYWDRKRNRLRKRTGPAWGTPEAKKFWAKFNKGIRAVLRKRGLERSMLYGLIGDARPTKQAMDDITTGVPNARWAVHSHYYCTRWQGYPIGMAIALWGIRCYPIDPSKGRGYGWMNPFWLMYYPREMSMLSPLVEHRTKLENWLGARAVSTSVYPKATGSHGLGRLGADFWPVLKSGRSRASLAGRYPESYWGQLNLNYGIPSLFGRGKHGPVPTVRSEAFRENVQEVEARVFIEKALTDKASRARLGDDLARRCRKALDERIRMCLYAAGEGRPWFISSGWTERMETLFRLASEVAAKSRP